MLQSLITVLHENVISVKLPGIWNEKLDHQAQVATKNSEVNSFVKTSVLLQNHKSFKVNPDPTKDKGVICHLFSSEGCKSRRGDKLRKLSSSVSYPTPLGYILN